MWLLVTLLLAQNVLAEGTQKDPTFMMKTIESCPDVGYFFQRQSAPNLFQQEACYLCFCRDNGNAACWLRENRRCKGEHYEHYGHREKRVRRYAKGFSDIFFRDAAKELFQKQASPECKPFESSKSYGCPPDDWCLGCTVCDCDAGGHWDCHVMSFCPDKKKMKTNKNIKQNSLSRRNGQIQKFSITANPKPANTRNVPNKIKRTTQKSNTPRTKKAVRKKDKVTTLKPVIKKLNVTTRKPNSVKVRTVFLMKNSTSKYPMSIKSTQVKFVVKPYNSTVKLAQKVPKRFVTVVHRKNNGTQYNKNDTMVGNRFVQKRAALKTNQIKGLKKSTVRNDHKNKAKISIISKKSIKKPDSVVRNLTTNEPNSNSRPKRDTLAVKDVEFGLNTTVNGNGLKYASLEELATVATNSGNINITSSDFKTPTPFTTVMDTFYTRDFYDNNNTKLNNSDSFNTDNIQIITLKTTEDDFKNDTSRDIITNLVESEITKGIDILDGKDIKKNHNWDLNITSYKVNDTSSKTHLISNKMNVFKIRQNKNDTYRNMIEKDFYRIRNQTGQGFENKTDGGNLNSSQIKLTKYEIDRSHSTHNQTKLPNVSETDPLLVIYNNTRDIAKLDNKKTRKNKLVNKSKRYKARRIIQPNFNLAKKNKDRSNNLQSFLQNFLNVFPSKNNITEENPQIKSFNIIRYLKKIMKYIFSKNKSKGIKLNNKQINKPAYDVNIIALLCEYFGPCQIKSKYKVILKSKLTKLNTEVTKIMKTIGTIKGLLQLIDLPNNYKNVEYNLIDEDINIIDDINKLKSIIKGTYDKKTLTETQILQIEYIKNTTKEFLKSIANFATVLDEIIEILANKNKENYKIDKYRNLKSMKIEHNIRNKKQTLEETLNSLRNILIKYNVVQNTFIRNIYGIINKFESKLNISKKPGPTLDKKVNNTEAIEAYARNIIKNLRKLKDIANKLNDKNSRHKREVPRDNDGLEYVLTMMEYMLKQNYPLDMVPANDGIDLLIDAIRNAPDIKPIEKKVLKYKTKTKFTTLSTTEEAELNNFEEDSSNSIVISKENNTTSQVDEVKGVDDKPIVFSDTDYEDLKVYSTLTQKPLVDKGDNLQLLEEEPVMDIHTRVVTKASAGNKIAEENLFNFEKKFHRGNDFYDVTKYDVFQADVDDDVTVNYKATTEHDTESSTEVNTESTPVANTPTVKTVTLEKVTSNYKTTKKFSFIENSEESEERLSSDKRSKTDWIDEGNLMEVTVNMSITTAKPTERDPSTEKTNVSMNQNISAVSKELVDEEIRNSKNKPDDVVYKKEMDLLNSLDYGTEKSEMEENESRDGLPDRYSGDYFL